MEDDGLLALLMDDGTAAVLDVDAITMPPPPPKKRKKGSQACSGEVSRNGSDNGHSYKCSKKIDGENRSREGMVLDPKGNPYTNWHLYDTEKAKSIFGPAHDIIDIPVPINPAVAERQVRRLAAYAKCGAGLTLTEDELIDLIDE